MIKVSVMYPNRDGATFDMDYYCQKHMALVEQLLGSALKGISIDKGIDQPTEAAPFLAIGHLLFDSVESFQAALAAHGAALMADIPNYTNVPPKILVSDIAFQWQAGGRQASA